MREELSVGGFETLAIHGVLGGAWLAPQVDELMKAENSKAVLMQTIRMLDGHEKNMDLSGHLLAVSRKTS